MKLFLSVLIVLLSPLIVAADNAAIKKELKLLQGSWKAVGLEAGGQALPKEAIPDFIFTIDADGNATGKMAKTEYTAKMIVNPSKDPKTIDNIHETGAQKGKKQFGVYKLEGDKLTVCMTPPGRAESDRPKGFVTKDTTNVVFIFERVKTEKKP